MRRFGNELEFISWIKRDGSGTEAIGESYLNSMQDEEFNLTCLSMTEKTFIATNFNSFVVRLREKEKVIEYKYEMFFQSDEEDHIKIDGWYPIATNCIKNPEKIEHYLQSGILRNIKNNRRNEILP